MYMDLIYPVPFLFLRANKTYWAGSHLSVVTERMRTQRVRDGGRASERNRTAVLTLSETIRTVREGERYCRNNEELRCIAPFKLGRSLLADEVCVRLYMVRISLLPLLLLDTVRGKGSFRAV